MIKSRNDVFLLFEDYSRTQHELNCQFYTNCTEKWSGKRLAIYANGIVCGKVREGDRLTMQTLKKGVSEEALYNEICLYYKRQIKNLKLEKDNIINNLNIIVCEKQFQDLNEIPLDQWINDNCKFNEIINVEFSHSEFKVFLYLYYAYYNYSYDKHFKIIDTETSIFPKCDRYGLVNVDQNRKILHLNPPRIYDCSIKKTFFTNNVPLHLLQNLSEMI